VAGNRTITEFTFLKEEEKNKFKNEIFQKEKKRRRNLV
jgi:hypothetical protein